MSVASLMDFLAGDQLTKLARAFAVRPGLKKVFPEAFYTPGPNKPVGTTVKWRLLNGGRETAKILNPESPSATAQGVQTDEKKIVAIGSRENYTVPLELIQAIQSNMPVLRENARQELETQLSAFAQRFANLRINAVHSALVRGIIDVGSDGSIQTSTSSPVRSITMTGVAGTRLTTDGSGSTFAIGDWSSASTDIVTKVRELKRLIVRLYGFELTDVYYGINVPSHLAKNTIFKEYLARNPQYNNNFVSTGEIPDGVLGLRWHGVGDATTVASGTATSWAGDNFLAFSPDPSDNSWYEMFECGLPCPIGLTSEAEISSAMLSPEAFAAKLPIQYGLHSYTIFNSDPIQAKVIAADYALPVIKSPNVMPRGVCA